MQTEHEQPSKATDRFARRWWYHLFLGVMLSLHLLAPIGLESGRGVDLLAFSWVGLLVLSVVFARRGRVELGVAAALLLASLTGLLGGSWAGPSQVVSVAARLAFMVFIAALILRELSGHPVVTLGTLSGAFVVYLLLSEAFVDAYDLAEATTEYASMNGVRPMDEVSSREEYLERRLDLTYFSLVTMTTLGYGDISPRDHLTRSLATLQALIGQAYLAVMIARLVSMYRSPRSTAS